MQFSQTEQLLLWIFFHLPQIAVALLVIVIVAGLTWWLK